jgi:Leucine-rich repeat (LRR) protein
MTNPIHPSYHNPVASTSSNQITQSPWSRITSAVRDRLRSPQPYTEVNSFINLIPKDIKTALNCWKREAPTEMGRKKFCKSVYSFFSNPNMLSLSAKRLGLSSLPEIFYDPELRRRLEILDLSVNNLISLPSTVLLLKNLRILRVSHNKLEKIPNGFFDNLKNLEQLALVDNCLLELPELPLEKLNYLNISYNYLTKIPEQFLKLKEHFIFTGNPNVYLSNSAACKLDLGDPASSHTVFRKKIRIPFQPPTHTINNLQEQEICIALKDWLEQSPERENRKEACDRIASFLVTLKHNYLNLEGLGLSSLPNIFINPRFNELKYLNLSNNQLTAIPEEIIHLKNLVRLDISNNKFNTLALNLQQKLVAQFKNRNYPAF